MIVEKIKLTQNEKADLIGDDQIRSNEVSQAVDGRTELSKKRAFWTNEPILEAIQYRCKVLIKNKIRFGPALNGNGFVFQTKPFSEGPDWGRRTPGKIEVRGRARDRLSFFGRCAR